MPLQSLAIIEDDERVRQFLAELVGRHFPGLRLEEFADGESALRELTANPVQLVLFDIELPGMNGIECIRRLKVIHPRIDMMALTVYDNTDNIFEALEAGASSYILKSTSPDKILEAIQELHDGGSPMSSQIARKVIEAFQIKHKANDFFQTLSRREQEILEYLSRGYRYKEIGEKLAISTETVRTHVHNIYEKLQVNNRVAALKKTGLI